MLENIKKYKWLIIIGAGGFFIIFLLLIILIISISNFGGSSGYYSTSEGKFTCTMSLPIATQIDQSIYDSNNYCAGSDRNEIIIQGAENELIRSVADGKVVEVIDYSSIPSEDGTKNTGYRVTIEHTTEDDTFYSIYDELGTINVLYSEEVETLVTKEQQIGTMSNNGSQTTPHFLFSMQDINKNFIDVNKFFGFQEGSSICSISEETFESICVYNTSIEDDLDFLCNMEPPLDSISITELFGYRPNDSRGYFHPAIDFGVILKDVKAIMGGTVIVSKGAGGYGNTIVIDHNNGYYSRYCHLDTLKVNVGDVVQQKDIIAISGDTGDGGFHLDIRVYKTEFDKNECLYRDGKECYINLNPFFGYTDGKMDGEIYPCVVYKNKILTFKSQSNVKSFLNEYHCNCMNDGFKPGAAYCSERKISSTKEFKEKYCGISSAESTSSG